MRELSEAWYGHNNPNPQRYDGSRYHGLNLNSLFFRGTIEFRYFKGTLHAGEVKAYLQLVLAMAEKALTSKAASSKRREVNIATAKYGFRVFLLGLGLIGDEFKTARLPPRSGVMKIIMRDDREFVGTPTQIVWVMKDIAFGVEHLNLAQYIEWVVANAKKFEEVELRVTGEADDELSASLVDEMIRTGHTRRV